MIKSPIIYCCYNRPDLVKKSIIKLAKIRTNKIYIWSDGPKKNVDDINKCKAVKKIILNTKFNSNVKYFFNKKNLGCKYSISKAISWMFEKERSGIILEDDMIPSSDFFEFCDYGLKKYRNNNKVMMISGTNYMGSGKDSDEYFFSSHYLIWGWATWKNAWKKYDVEMKGWKDRKIRNYIKRYNTPEVYRFLSNRFDQLHKDYKDTWDIQWYFTCVKHRWLSMTPKANLVTNIGVKGTHSHNYYDTLYLKVGKINFNNVKGPKKILANQRFDKKIHLYFNFDKTLIRKLLFKLKFYFNIL
jgi:hypothetical protein